MAGSISLLLSRTEGSAQGSVAYVNGLVSPLLRKAGWMPRSIQLPPDNRTEEATLPFGLASIHAFELMRGPADMALYDDAGAAIRTPSRRWARRNVVLYHGLAYGAGAWMANPDIDLHCANSPYLARVLRALLALPDWRGRRCLDERAFDNVTDIALPLPCLAGHSHAAFAEGADIPAAAARLLDGQTVVGHALQGRKHDVMATLSILYWMNDIARQRGTPPVKLLLSAASLDGDRRRAIDAMLAPSGYRCDDFFVLVPHLRQAALFELMRACRFGLAYNRFPEPFGFHILESVFNGCPVYTNGIGNNRHVLPPDHGIVVDENFEMACEVVDAGAYRGVAERIHADLAQPAATQAMCARGAAVIREKWSNDAFARSLGDALVHAGKARETSVAFDELVVAPSPLVRHLDLSTGRCLNDYANVVLAAAEIAEVHSLLGRYCGDLDGARMQALEESRGLFRRGILTLLPPRGVDDLSRTASGGNAPRANVPIGVARAAVA